MVDNSRKLVKIRLDKQTNKYLDKIETPISICQPF